MSEDPTPYRTVNPRLKGCPFCGAHPEVAFKTDKSPWVVGCKESECDAGPSVESWASLEDAESKWNQRNDKPFAELKMREPNALRISQNGKVNLHLGFHRLEEFTVTTKGRLAGSEVEAVEVTLLFYRGPGAAQLP